MPRPPKPVPKWAYKDIDKIIRIGVGHPDLGKYQIVVSQIVEHKRALGLGRGLNSMPSNRDPEMFKVFKAAQDAVIRNDVSKLVRVPGFIVKRKVLLNDRLEFLDGEGN